jgi:hypothetical protein
MAGDALIIGAVAAGFAGIAALRLAWGQPRRSRGLVWTGWGFLLGAAAAGWLGAGAWGVAVAALAAMTLAMILLARSAATSVPGRVPASNRRAGMLPAKGEPLSLMRRANTFVIVALLAALAAAAMALGTRWLASLAGMGPADSTVAALFVMPLAWTILSTVLLMQGNRRSQLRLIALCCLPALPPVLIGVGA